MDVGAFILIQPLWRDLLQPLRRSRTVLGFVGLGAISRLRDGSVAIVVLILGHVVVPTSADRAAECIAHFVTILIPLLPTSVQGIDVLLNTLLDELLELFH